MTSEQLEYIGQRLNVEKLPVTSLFLSRTWNISSKKASEILSAFYKKFKTNSMFENISVKYIVCGEEKYNGNQRHADILVKIVDMDELDDINSQFNNIISNNIYSIHLNKEISLSNIIESCKVKGWDYTVENMTSCELIQTETSGLIDPSIKSELTNETIKTENIKTENIKTEPKSNEIQRSVYQSRKSQSNPVSGSGSTPTPSLSMFSSRYTSRKSEKRVPETTKPKTTKRAKTMPSIEQQQCDEETKSKEAHKQKEDEALQDLMDVDFSDDDDDFNDGVVIDDNTKTEKNPKTEYKFDDIDIAESDNETEETKLLEADNKKITKQTNQNDDTFDDSFDFDDLKEIPRPKKPEPEAEPVPDVETYTDSDGFIVRKINRKEPPKPKQSTNTTPAKRSFTIDTKSTKSGTGVKKQGNLMSFFKKK